VKKTLSVEEGTFTSIGFGVHVEDTIQNGVKETSYHGFEQQNIVEDTIQNGVKHTQRRTYSSKIFLEDTIQNGVKI
jgi:hypothetical protein